MNGHHRDQAKVSVHCRWPLIRGNLTLKCVGRGIGNEAVQGRWPLTTGVAQGRYYCMCFRYILLPLPQHESLSTWFSVPHIGTSTILLSMRHYSFLLTCPYRLIIFSVIFFTTDATFTDPRTCSFMIVSFAVTSHIHLSIVQVYLSLCTTHKIN